MYRFALAVACLVLAIPNSAIHATTLTFDSTADCSTTQVSITAGTAASPCGLGISPNGTSALVSSRASPREAFWTAIFTSVVTGVSIDLGDFNEDPDPFNSSHVLIGSTSVDISSSFTGMVNLALPGLSNIASVEFGVTGDFGGIYADNLSFTAAAVPVPAVGAGLPGLALAFGGFLAWRRRRKPKHANNACAQSAAG
jgi:hypothetical protein